MWSRPPLLYIAKVQKNPEICKYFGHFFGILNLIAIFATLTNPEMGAIYIIEGILIYIYGFDHNPPHIHVKCGDGEFTITIKDRIVEGRAKARVIQVVNRFLDEHENEVMAIWEKAQRGEKIEKIGR